MKARLHELLVNGVNAAFEWTRGATLYETQCRRSAESLCALVWEIGIYPVSFFDVGANDSQVAKWVVREFPLVRVVSFEPCTKFNPIGEVHRVALGDRNEVRGLRETNSLGAACPYLDEWHGGENRTTVRRFDTMALRVDKPAVLKVDAENYTLKALRGFGNRLRDFSVVACEVANHMPDQPQMDASGREAGEVYSLMAAHGFRASRVLDAGQFHRRRVAHYDVAFWRPV